MMKNRSSRRRNAPQKGAVKLTRSAMLALALLGAVDVASQDLRPNALLAQAIINNDKGASNNSNASFSASSNKDSVTGAFAPNAGQPLKLPAPSGSPSPVNDAQFVFPFVFPQGSDPNGMESITLLSSYDKGATWYPYAVVTTRDSRRQFLFEAPDPGEYWFALMTTFKSGKRSFSSTRAMTFAQGIGEQEENFALADDSDEAEDAAFTPVSTTRSVDAPAPLSAPSEDPEELSELDDLQAPPPLSLDDSGSLLINNASFEGEEEAPTPPATEDVQPAAESIAWPGKLKNLSFGVGKASGALMATVRWFTPAELNPADRRSIKSLSVERGPSENGPWTIIAEDLNVEENGYSWTATPEEMKPFYVRTVARDSEGNVWRDVTTSPMDVNNKAVRSALGPVKTPAPFTEPAEDDSKESSDENDLDSPQLIRHTASEASEPLDKTDDKGADNEGTDDKSTAKKSVPTLDPASDLRNAKSDVRLVSNVERAAAPAPRPYIPAPTNPNEFQLNPLFTQGFSVLFQSAQTRPEPTTAKRSIFTPPSRGYNTSSVRPAEHRPSAYQRETARIEQERRAYEERARYNREREMEMFEKQPELMEGRMFYQDANGNITTTPPPEMQEAFNFNEANMAAMGWTRVDDQNGSTAEDQSLYMPRDAELYDSSARSGAAIFNNMEYPNASSPGSSPINNRYSSQPEGTPNSAPTATGTNPQSSYNPLVSPYPGDTSTTPYYVSNAAQSGYEYALPPTPSSRK